MFWQNHFYLDEENLQNFNMNKSFVLQPTEFDINPQNVSTPCEAEIAYVTILLEEHFRDNASDCKRLATQIIERIDIRFIAYK